MIIRLSLILLLVVNAFQVNGQGMTTHINDYLKRNKIPYYTCKDSLKSPNKSGYFFTNRKGQTTLSLPKGAIDLSVPVGDSVVYGKIKSPSFAEEAIGQLVVAEYVDGVNVKNDSIGMGKINATTGIRVDWCIDNKENTTLNLYFLSGQIICYPLNKSSDRMIHAFFMSENLKSVKMGDEVRTCLLYEDTKDGKVKHKLEQWFKKTSEKEFMAKVAKGLKSYYVISYKMKRP